MASEPRRFNPNRAYHVYNRAIVEKQRIFLSNRDYQRFLATLEYYLLSERPTRFSIFQDFPPQLQLHPKGVSRRAKLLAYAVMPNHFHLLIKPIPESPFELSRFVSDLTNSYTRYFNLKYGRNGILFQGTFKSKEIADEESLLQVSRYIHLNPLLSSKTNPQNRLNKPQDYPYSSYLEWSGFKNPHLIDEKEVELFVSLVGGSHGYREFVESKIGQNPTLEIGHLAIE